MENNKIKEILEYRFNLVPEFPKKRHIIFWYDSDKAFKDMIPELELDNVKIITLTKEINRKGEFISKNIFKTKYVLEYEDSESNYLIYSEYEKPDDRENFLVDIEKYSEYFMADKSAMIIEEFKLDRTNYNLSQVIKEHLDFFGSKDRREKLEKLMENPESMTERDLKLSILAVAVNSKSIDIQEILKNIILDRSRLEAVEKWIGTKFLFEEIKNKFSFETDDFDKFLKTLLVVNFYRELQEKPHTNLEKYYKGKTNEIYIFVSSLLQNKQTADKVKEIFFDLGEELDIKSRINELDFDILVQGTAFEYFDKIAVKYIAENISSEAVDYDKYLRYINIRLDSTLWKEKYFIYYKMLITVINILKIKQDLVIKDKSINGLFEDYTNIYYRIDKLYREFFLSYDEIKGKNSNEIFDSLERKVSQFYEKDYLENLLSLWSDNFITGTGLPYQKDFYDKYIKSSDTRVAVIISDGLRYEVGSEIFEKLKKEASAKEITLKGMLTSLPSITDVGMTNLLPNENREINPLKEIYTVSGINSKTTENRERILKLSCEESSAISFKVFKNMGRTEQDEFIKGKRVIYIYHDNIDGIGDKGKTEDETFEACDMAVKDIVGMSKLLSSLGVVNIYITSDHGFLYEKKSIEEYNKLELDKTELEPVTIGKRYALYEKEIEQKGCITVKMDNYFGVFPKKDQRIKTSGSGLQFVHGGISPQEMIVPLIQYRSGVHSKKAVKVRVRIKESIGKLTSNLSRFAIYQLDSVSIKDKVLERDISAGLYDGDVRVSNEVKIRLNACEENFQHDFRLTLSGEHKKVTLKIMDLETGDILDSKEYVVKVGIISDFDF